jgi:hypothetical protein
MRFRVAVGAAMVAVLCAVAASGVASAARPNNYTCSGGSIPSGNYSSITVTGLCDVVPNAVINVSKNIDVAAGAVFDAQSAPSTITVGHNVTAAAGSLLGLGCQPENTIGRFAGVPCVADPTGQTVITVNGNITATDANTVLIRKVTVNGNVTLTGGISDNPWSIKGSAISGNLTISGLTAEFLGVQFNTIGKNATLTNITVNDVDSPPPGVTIVENTVRKNLNCSGLVPGVSPGFIPGETNHVGHKATGQCAAISVPL